MKPLSREVLIIGGLFFIASTSYAQFSEEDIKAVLFLNGKKQILEVHDDIRASWKVNIDKAKSSKYTDESQEYSRIGDVMRNMALLLEAYLNMEYMAVYSADKKVADNVVNDWRDRIKTCIIDNRSYYKRLKDGGVTKEIRENIEKQENLLERLGQSLVEEASADKKSKASSSRAGISCADSIQIAEKFIKEQGYVDAPVSISHDDIVFESLEWGGNPDEILAKRKGTLNSKARGAYDDKKWFVFFSYTNPAVGADRGRAVRLDKDGKNAIMEHQDADLSNSVISCS